MEKMAGVETHEWTRTSVSGHVHLPAGRWEGFIPLRGLVDPEAERRRIDRAMARLRVQVSRSTAKLDNPNFVERAPGSVVENERLKLAQANERLDSLRLQREAL